jgi:ribonuclease R
MSKQSSQMEVKAADAERASVKFKQVEYIKDFVGDEFAGIISGVTEWGLYVEISQYRAEGLLRIANLGDDFYDYDENNHWIIGRRTHRKFQLGDQISVVVVAADIFKRQIDLSLAGENVRFEGKRGKDKGSERRGKSADRGNKSGKKRRR